MRLKQLATLVLLAALVSASAANNDLVEGNPAATVRVTIFNDLQCDYCQTLRTMLDEKLLPKYGQQVAFVYRDLPLAHGGDGRSLGDCTEFTPGHRFPA